MADPKKKRTWVAVAVAILIILGIFGVALVGGAAFWVRRHINAQFTSVEAASSEFERERARFAGQSPLIELQAENERPIVHRRTAEARTELQTLRVLVYDARAGKIVRVSLPFWLLRLAPSKPLRLSGSGVDFDSDHMRLTVDDLERAGPGLLLDAKNGRNGEQVLAWTE